MTLKPQTYIPCLRWKQGEYQAISRLSSTARSSIMPIIEIPEQGYDFEEKQTTKTLDEHLLLFTHRVKKKWGTNGECYLDMHHVPLSQSLGDGRRPADLVFDNLKANNIRFVPVSRLHEDSFYESALYNFVKRENCGFCLRVNLDEFGEDDFETKAADFLHSFGLTFSECDMILDLGAINFDPIAVFSSLLTDMMKSKSRLHQWITFGIIGTSFPQTLAGNPQGISYLPRNEWVLYKLLFTSLQNEGVRIPIFGDYTINHPEVITVDMRIIKPSANIRYTIDDKWLICKGQNVRDYGLSQFQQLCQMTVNTKHYNGQKYSYGDDYIYKCAQGTAKTGNLSTWREVGTNHHIEMLVRDLSNLVAS
jgi:hypothetical protein